MSIERCYQEDSDPLCIISNWLRDILNPYRLLMGTACAKQIISWNACGIHRSLLPELWTQLFRSPNGCRSRLSLSQIHLFVIFRCRNFLLTSVTPLIRAYSLRLVRWWWGEATAWKHTTFKNSPWLPIWDF